MARAAERLPVASIPHERLVSSMRAYVVDYISVRAALRACRVSEEETRAGLLPSSVISTFPTIRAGCRDAGLPCHLTARAASAGKRRVSLRAMARCCDWHYVSRKSGRGVLQARNSPRPCHALLDSKREKGARSGIDKRLLILDRQSALWVPRIVRGPRRYIHAREPHAVTAY